MSEIDLDKDLQDMMNSSGADEGASGGESSGGLGGLSEDLGSLVGEGSSDAPADKGDAFSLDDDMKSMMEESSGGGSGGGTGQSAPMSSAAFAPVASGGGAISLADSPNLEFLLDIKLNVTFEVGRAKMLISDLLTLGQGSVIELHRLVGDELDLLVNGRLIAKGEVVVINEKFGCKIASIISPEDRVKHMGGM
jgi:flagellar motor switch protein FliN